MELHEFRESVDIDLICPTTESYRAVRETVTQQTLGSLVRGPLNYAREVRVTRDKLSTAIGLEVPVKLEVINFANWNIGIEDSPIVAVPVVDREACFAMKLTAANDRGMAEPYKDVVDLIAMQRWWGSIPAAAIREAQRHYGSKVVDKAEAAIRHFDDLPRETRRDVALALKLDEAILRGCAERQSPNRAPRI